MVNSAKALSTAARQSDRENNDTHPCKAAYPNSLGRYYAQSNNWLFSLSRPAFYNFYSVQQGASSISVFDPCQHKQ
jgi:hypothetical protein